MIFSTEVKRAPVSKREALEYNDGGLLAAYMVTYRRSRGTMCGMLACRPCSIWVVVVVLSFVCFAENKQEMGQFPSEKWRYLCGKKGQLQRLASLEKQHEEKRKAYHEDRRHCMLRLQYFVCGLISSSQALINSAVSFSWCSEAEFVLINNVKQH